MAWQSKLLPKHAAWLLALYSQPELIIQLQYDKEQLKRELASTKREIQAFKDQNNLLFMQPAESCLCHRLLCLILADSTIHRIPMLYKLLLLHQLKAVLQALRLLSETNWNSSSSLQRIKIL